MSDVFKKLMDLFNKREKIRFFILMFLMIIVAFAEVLGMSTILVLLRILSKPELIQENTYMIWAYEYFGFTSPYNFQVFMSASVFAVVAIGLCFKAAGAFAIVRFSTMRSFTISSRLLEAYLQQPYTWFLERNSSEISTAVLGEVGQLINMVMIPSLQLISNIILALTITAFMIYIDPVIALMSAFVLGGGYLIIYLSLRASLARHGVEMMEANRSRFRLTNEAVGGFKELKLLALEQNYVNRFIKPARKLARLTALVQLMRQVPRYALEALTFAILVSVILMMLIRNNGDLVAAVPILGAFAMSVMRLLPALQQIYFALASTRNGKPLLDKIHYDYMDSIGKISERPVMSEPAKKFPLQQVLEFKNASFSYPSTEKSAIQGLNLIIPAHQTIGIVGGTGAGKTTVVDLILGLLTLQEGDLLVDGVAVNRENIVAWRRSLGYVPQTIFLTDNTVAENIAFGVDPNDIDMQAVERAAKIAALHNFVTDEMPEQYQTIVGERGVRLSGGQRQRIGIARALYRDPDLIIMDEATSALDNLTERAVMEAVHNIGHDKTIIMIAHRLSTVKNCDVIFLMEHGSLAASGTFDELVAKNETFREMAANG